MGVKTVLQQLFSRMGSPNRFEVHEEADGTIVYGVANQYGTITATGVGAITDPLTGGISFVASTKQYSHAGIVPPTTDYAGIMAARAVCIAQGGGVVALQNTTYNLGSNYIPIDSGVSYIGIPGVMRYTNGGWTDRDDIPTGGTIIVGDNSNNAFWDGLIDLGAVTTTVAASTATFTAGSTSVGVVNSANYPVGSCVYFTTSGSGFFVGLKYFVLTAAANVLTLGLAEKVAIAATGSGTLQISAGFPNEGTTGTEIKNIIFSGVRSAVKMGAVNALGPVHCTFDNLYVMGQAGYRCFDFMNFVHTKFSRLYSSFGNGHYYGCNIPSATLEPGNCDFTDIYNINNSKTAKGLIFESYTGAHLNELHLRMIQNNNAFTTLETQNTSGMANASANITVTDGTQFPVDMPVWTTTAANPNGFTTNLTYFVITNNGSNVITLSATKGGAAKTSTGSAAMNLNTYGYPGLEMAAFGTGTIANFDLAGLDVEGYCSVGVLLQGTTGNILVNQISNTAMHAGICGRSHDGIIWNRDPSLITDFDSASQNTQVYGKRNNTVLAGSGNPGIGIYKDSTIGGGCWVFNMHGGKNQAFPDVKAVSSATNGEWLLNGNPQGQPMSTLDVTGALSAGGWYTFAGAASQTLTLPTIANASAISTTIGYPIYVSNAGANAVTIATDGTQLFNNIATKTSMSLASGQWLRCTGAKTAGGTFYWIAETNGTI
jgi:hypothetical protein